MSDEVRASAERIKEGPASVNIADFGIVAHWALPLLDETAREWYSVEYWDDEAGEREPFEYPDEGGWVTARPSDGTFKHAQISFDIHKEKHPKIRIVRNIRAIVQQIPLTEKATP